MKRILILLAVFITCCAPKTIVTESGKSAWYANQVTIRINELSATVIKLNALGTINDDDTRTFGTWAKSALITLKAIPTGWEKTVQAGWYATKANLPASFLSNPSVSMTITVFEALLELLNPPLVSHNLGVIYAY